MFTGIIQGRGKLLSRRSTKGGLAFEVEADFEISEPQEGESIAVSGACLTAYNIHGKRFMADVSPESLSRTTLGKLAANGMVNLERALRLSDRLGGHLVSGHIDCIGRVSGIKKQGEFTVWSFSVPEEQDRYIVEKGSIAIDGISLTVNSCSRGTFSVSIIPHTMDVTTLGTLRNGSVVNIEVDIIGKYIEKLLSAKPALAGSSSGINSAFLAESGYL
ncbi:MAG: riboflavin synthase [Desulfobacterales bacterium]|nr:riboflavin synthase [Desulfobacterales bacterium]